MHLIISGPPLSGKTTIAQELGKRLQIPVFDTDHILEKKHQIQCSALFRTFEEKKIREEEYLVLDKLLQVETPSIISLGGGMLTYPKSADRVKEGVLHISLVCSFETLLNRLKQLDRIPAYVDPNKLEETFRLVYEERRRIYQHLPHFSVDVTDQTPLQSATTIQDIYES